MSEAFCLDSEAVGTLNRYYLVLRDQQFKVERVANGPLIRLAWWICFMAYSEL